MTADIKPAVIEGIKELIEAFGEGNVKYTPEDSGGAIVFVNNVDVGGTYAPSIVWFGFIITFNYPHADVYPHYCNLKRSDGNALGGGFGNANWQGKDCVQISRRSNNWNPATDTAALKLAKVIKWVKEQ